MDNGMGTRPEAKGNCGWQVFTDDHMWWVWVHTSRGAHGDDRGCVCVCWLGCALFSTTWR